MPLFLCDECNCVDNTATGHYWSRNGDMWKDESKNGKALCSECSPDEYKDGSKNPRGGKWHGKFEKQTLEEFKKEWPKAELENYEL